MSALNNRDLRTETTDTIKIMERKKEEEKRSITVSKTKPKWKVKMTRGRIISGGTWFGYRQKEKRKKKERWGGRHKQLQD